jgi:hypothetical protein
MGEGRGEGEEGSHFTQLITPSPLSPARGGNSTFYEIINFDDLVKSRESRHSCGSRSPELLELTGLPLSRKFQKWDQKDFLRIHQFWLSDFRLRIFNSEIRHPQL